MKQREDNIHIIMSIRTLLMLTLKGRLCLCMASALLPVILGIMPYGAALIDREIMNFLQTKSGADTEYAYAFLLVSGLALLYVTQWIVGSIGSFLKMALSNKVSYDINLRIAERFHQLSFQEYEDQEFLRLFDLMKKGDNPDPSRLYYKMLSLFQGIVTLASFTIALARQSIPMCILIYIAMFPFYLLKSRTADVGYRFDAENSLLTRKKHYYEDIFVKRDAAKEMRIYDTEPFFYEKYKAANLDYLKSYRDKYLFENKYDKLSDVYSKFISIAVRVYAGFLAVSGAIDFGTFTFLIAAYDQVAEGLEGAFRNVFDVKSGGMYGSALHDFLHDGDEPLLYEHDPLHYGAQGDSDGIVLRHIDSIAFKDVKFKYPGSDSYVLDGLSFQIEKGETVGIVGLNGSGKSTIIKLLLRLYRPESGAIKINGIDIWKYEPRSFYDAFGCVFQESARLAMSIRENICIRPRRKEYGQEAYAKEAYDAEKIGHILSVLQLEDWIQSLPNGLDTILTKEFDDDGTEPSGGIWQKLSIARAIYNESEVIIMDEPSASIDTETEKMIFERYQEITEERTSILISHRLANITVCHKILVLGDGHVIEQGSHGMLMEKEGVYAHLFRLQADKYADS